MLGKVIFKPEVEFESPVAGTTNCMKKNAITRTRIIRAKPTMIIVSTPSCIAPFSIRIEEAYHLLFLLIM